MTIKALGKAPSKDILKKVQQSPQYREGEFKNIEHTDVMRKDASYAQMMLSFFSRPRNITPKKPILTVKTDLKNIIGDVPQINWFGHSSYMITYKGKHILVDPVFGSASPVKFFVRPFPGTAIYSADDLPFIETLILTHDHYDHLDYVTVSKLKDRVGKVVCSLGVSSHLIYWGFKAENISELDWHDTVSIDGVKITATPARHFSGRLLKRNQTLWNSYVVEFDTYKMFIGGDSGYDGQFKKTGEQYGPFDIAFVECGQYGKDWPNIHMFPEQTAQAALDLKIKILFPVHWGKFALAAHPWNESIQRLLKAVKDMPYTIVSPKIGETYSLGNEFTQEDWWNK